MARPASDKRERLSAAAAEFVASLGSMVRRSPRSPTARASRQAASTTTCPRSPLSRMPPSRIGLIVAPRLSEWGASGDPRPSLTAYLDAAVEEASQSADRGTIGTLAAQLRTTAPEAAEAAARVIRDTVSWAAANFEQLGFAPDAAAARALHLVTGIEGAGQLAHALGDTTPIERESAHLSRWVASSRASA